MYLKDFLDCFDTLDVCKYNTKWFVKRFEFKLPFNPMDRENFTVFEIRINCKKLSANFTLYQRIHRESEQRYHLSSSILIYKICADGSMQLVCNSNPMWKKIENFQTYLIRGRYLLMVFSLNHWSITSRLREPPSLVMAIHTNRSIKVKPKCPDSHLIGDLLIAAVIAIGSSEISETSEYIEWKLKKFSFYLWSIENLTTTKYLVIRWDTSRSINSFNIRSTDRGVDIVPPNSRQIICLMGRESDKLECNFVCLYSIKPIDDEKKLERYRSCLNGDVKSLSNLFAPRLVQSYLLAERNRSRNCIANITDETHRNTRLCSML
ncbi:hypothetical protein QR98_0095700 [Sarcoptes scabiei]|uniref:Uncharacterized protein n=1 Tax=Sarcoptes scabiei TaxID=52283 RepID=A0A132AKB0_SARSC|nr:hypothetical protein QR98_0095700 [Sarcoptes scabiei]